MKRIIITASLLGGMLYQTSAQEFTIGVNGAQAGTRYKLPNGKVQLKPSLGAEAGLQFRLSNHFKIVTGLEFFRYQSKAALADNKVYSHNLIDDMGSSFEYRAVTSSYSETQSITALHVPLLLQFTAGALQKTQWYFNAGGKFMLPSKVSVKANASKITTTGYYPDVNAEVHDLPQHGFGIVNNWQSSGSYSTKPGWLLSAGTGFSFKLSPSGKTRLYAGVYADYGISNLQAGQEPLSLITYNSQSVANVQVNGTMRMEGVTNLQLMNLGLQLKLGFGHKQKVKKSSVPQQAALQVPAQGIPQAAPKAEPATMLEAAEPPASASKQKSAIAAEERNLIEQPVSFGKKNNVDLNMESKQFLDTVASILNKYPGIRILIKGHTCDLGTPAVNEKRSLERATALANYLFSRGVNKERMQIAAMAASEPVAPNTSEENRQKNRRVAIVVSE